MGLGNTGMSRTRHNAGMMLVDHLAELWGARWERSGLYELARCDRRAGDDAELVLVKPRGFMNVCGPAIASAVKDFRVAVDTQLLVAHDDLQREMGKVSPKQGGSASGHNGVLSTIASLRTDSFQRLRIGIGRPTNADYVAEYVLERFTPREYDVFTGTVLPLCDSLVNVLVRPPPPPKAAAAPKQNKAKPAKESPADPPATVGSASSSSPSSSVSPSPSTFPDVSTSVGIANKKL